MASDSTPISSSAVTLVQGSQAPTATAPSPSAGKNSPPGGVSAANSRLQIAASPVNKSNPTAAATQAHDASDGRAAGARAISTSTAAPSDKPANAAVVTTSGTDGQTTGAHADVRNLVAQLNKSLNDSGRPDQFRVDPQSGSTIQEVNPANGAVIAQFAASEFPALARSVGASGLLFDSRA